MTTLAQAIALGPFTSIPAPGMPGRVYCTTDTQAMLYDTGTAWVNVSGGAGLHVTEVPLPPTSSGGFSVAHGITDVIVSATISMTSAGSIWFQSPTRFDSTYLYLEASDPGITGVAVVMH